jgi:probable phosphoglycerate mutase
VALTLHLVRHGQTEWNRERRIQGSSDVPLNATGLEQAVAAAAELASVPVGAVISSDLVRARQTAEPIAARHGLSVLVEPRLRERHFGRDEGRFDVDLEREYGAERLLELWRDPDAAFPDGETIRAHHHRVSRYLDELVATPPADHIVLVSHGGSVRRALNHLAGIAVEARVYEPIANGSVHTIQVPDGSPDAVESG